MTLDDLLRRIERGETTSADAEWLRNRIGSTQYAEAAASAAFGGSTYEALDRTLTEVERYFSARSMLWGAKFASVGEDATTLLDWMLNTLDALWDARVDERIERYINPPQHPSQPTAAAFGQPAAP